MALLRKISFDGHESDVQNFVPGDNVAFVTQSDGNIQINAAGGGSGSSYAAGEGIKISPQNVISADVRSDMLAPTEVNPAEDPHAVGEYVIYNNVLYRVISAIAVGDSLVEDSNIERDSVGKELYRIGDNVDHLLDGTLPKNISSAYTNLNSYTRPSSYFTVPKDGYVVMNVGTTAGLSAAVYIDDIPVLSIKNASGYPFWSLYVRANMRVSVSDVSSGAAVLYYPLAD